MTAIDNDPRWNDTSITPGSGNVFTDLGFDPAEAQIMKLRAEIMIRTAQRLKAQGWTQEEAARQLRITKADVSSLVKGHAEDFSLDTLLTLATRAGLHPELRLSTP